MAELSERLQTVLGSAYRLEKELGGGGMSRVFVAEETRLARRVVIKVLPPDLALGTPAYMAPEQAAGDPNIDARADIYAFGAMAYEMLTGRSPFAGMAPHQMLAAHVTEPVTPITNRRAAIPSALAELVMACLAKNPADRPQSADEILHLLDGIATPSGSQAITSSAATMRHLLRRPRNRALAFGAAAAMLLIGGWVALRPRSAAALDANRIAIAPFEVLGGTELGLWREGLVDVLSRSLDGAGPLRTAS